MWFDDLTQEEGNPYAVPISMGIFQILESPLDITTSTIIKRIVNNHEAYQASCFSSTSFIFLLHHSDQSLTSKSFCIFFLET